jgi:glycosyltransferase involved in cell wall biosynthesis
MQKLMYEISAVIPVTKMAGKLKNLEETIVNSADTHIEIIIVHDIRDKDTSSEILKLIDGRSNVKFLEGRYGSAGKARNAGIELANSKWICFWDSDDLPNIKNIGKLINKTEKDKNNLGYGSFELMMTRDKKKSVFHKHQRKTEIISINRFPGLWRWVFKRNLVDNNRFLEYRLGEDITFLCRLISLGGNISKFEGTVYQYTVGDKNQATQLWKESDSIAPVLKFIHSITRGGIFNNESKITKIAFWQTLSSIRKDNMKNKVYSIFYLLNIFVNMTSSLVNKKLKK